MGPIDLNLGPLIVLAVIGAVAVIGGLVWLAFFLIEHVQFV